MKRLGHKSREAWTTWAGLPRRSSQGSDSPWGETSSPCSPPENAFYCGNCLVCHNSSPKPQEINNSFKPSLERRRQLSQQRACQISMSRFRSPGTILKSQIQRHTLARAAPGRWRKTDPEAPGPVNIAQLLNIRGGAVLVKVSNTMTRREERVDFIYTTTSCSSKT